MLCCSPKGVNGMIEIIYKEDQKKSGEKDSFFRIPNNIRQIGEIRGHQKIYIEDYAYTFLKKISRNSAGEGRAAILLGQYHWSEGSAYLFIRSALQIEDIEVSPDHMAFTDKVWGQIYEEVLGGVISSAITTSIGICLIGGMTIVCTFARDKGFWGWYMAVPVLGTYCMMVLGFYPAILRYISYIAILLGNVFIGWQVYNGVMLPDGTPAANGFMPRQTSASNRSVPRQPPVVNRSMPRQPSADVGSMPRSAPPSV